MIGYYAQLHQIPCAPVFVNLPIFNDIDLIEIFTERNMKAVAELSISCDIDPLVSVLCVTDLD